MTDTSREGTHSHQQDKSTGQPTASLPLIIPEGIRYNCQGCGRCCSGWAVGLTEADWLKVKDTDWQSLHPELEGRELFVHRAGEFAAGTSRYPHYTKPREDGTCPFLIDNLCFIHGHLGESEKPSMCQLFPYTFSPTPSGIYVGLAYNSNAAVRNIGNLLSDQRGMLEEMWRVNVAWDEALTRPAQEALDRMAQSTGAASAGQFTVNLSSGLPLSWQEYLALEAALMRTLEEEHESACHLLLALGEVIAEAINLKREDKDLAGLESFHPSIDRWLGSTPTLVENLLFYMLSFRNFVWPELRKQHSELWSGTEKNPLSDPKILGAAFRTVFLKQIDLPGLGRIQLNDVLTGPVSGFTAEMYDFFRRYFYLRFFSKTYFGPTLSGLSVLSGFNNLVANFLSAVIFMKAHAIKRGDGSLAIADLYEGYFLLDKELVALTQLPAERAALYDTGFSTPRLFNRMLGLLAGTVSS